MSIDSNHLRGVDTADNALGLEGGEIRGREVIWLDVAGRKWGGRQGGGGGGGGGRGDGGGVVEERVEMGRIGRIELKEGWYKRFMKDCGEGGREVGKASGLERSEPSLRFSSSSTSLASTYESPSVSSHSIASTEAPEAPDDDEDEQQQRQEKQQSRLSSINEIEHEKVLNTTMCCYKVVKMEFTGFGLRRFVQHWVTKSLIPYQFLDIHRKMILWFDDWTDLSMKEIGEYEDRVARLSQKRGLGENRDADEGGKVGKKDKGGDEGVENGLEV